MIARALHRVLRLLLPRSFRQRFGTAMEATFLDALAAARRHGRGRVARLWLREAVDLAVTGRRARAELRRHGARFVAHGVARARVAHGSGAATALADDLAYAWRSLVRRPAISLFAVATLALGIGSTTAIFSTIESVLLNPLPFENGDRLVGLFRQVGDAQIYLTPGRDEVELWAGQEDVFERVEPWSGREMTLTGRGEPRVVLTAAARPSLFEMLGRSPTIGRLFDASELAGEGARVAVVDHGFWKREMGGAPDALGATLDLDGEQHTVIGVMEPKTLLPGWGLRAIDVWLPYTDRSAETRSPVTGLLREGVDAAAANERLTQLGELGDGRSGGHASPVAEQVGRGLEETLGLLMGAVVLLLLISCVNVSNLLLFRADARRRETAVRAAVGGGRGRLARQLLIESVMLALGAGLLGIGLAYVGQKAIVALRPGQLDVLEHIGINERVLGFALAVAVVTGLVFGLLPALRGTRADALAPLRSGARSEGDLVGRRLRWVLVSGEVALSFALLMGSLAVLTTVIVAQRADLGFDADRVVVMELGLPVWKLEDEARATLHEELLGRLQRIPGVASVSRASGVPPRAGLWFGNLQVEGGEPSESPVKLLGLFVGSDYFRTVGQRVVAGRAFTPEDVEGEQQIAIVGASTAEQLFGQTRPVGTRFRLSESDDWLTVVGVVDDVAMTGPRAAEPELQLYVPLREEWTSSTVLVRAAPTADPSALLGLVREIAVSVDPELRIDRLALATAVMQDALERERFATAIMAAFATLALLLAAVGLYGVVSQVVGRRTREIGIRIALGAHRSSIASIVLRRAGGATALGIVGGVVLAMSVTRLLGTRFAELAESSPLTYGLAAAGLALTALLAAYGPARRAVRVDPVEAMRIE